MLSLDHGRRLRGKKIIILFWLLCCKIKTRYVILCAVKDVQHRRYAMPDGDIVNKTTQKGDENAENGQGKA